MPVSESLTKDPAWLYEQVTARLGRLKDSKLEDRLVRHIRAKTGYLSPKAFNLGGSENQRREVFGELLSAMLRNDFSQLLGQEAMVPAKCQAEVEVQTFEPGRISTYSVDQSNADQALSTLIALLTTPGITAQVQVKVVINQTGEPLQTIDDAQAYKG